jgi:arginine deiminase
MNSTDTTIYTLLLYAMPVLLAVLAFIGGLAVNSLMKMSDNLNEIKITVQKMISEHESLEQSVKSIHHRVEKVEDKIFR